MEPGVQAQINQIADSPDRPLGEALSLLPWTVFENPAHRGESSEDHLARLTQWGEALREYSERLQGEIETLELQYHRWLGIWEQWCACGWNTTEGPDAVQRERWDDFLEAGRQDLRRKMAEVQREIARLRDLINDVPAGSADAARTGRVAMSRGLITTFVPPHVTAHVEAAAVEPEPAFPGWTTFAAQRSIRGIAVAPGSGTLWLATWGGVIAWNRREKPVYRRYGSEHGLVGNGTACIGVDPSGRAWAGCDEGGLCYFDGGRWRVYEHLQEESIRVVCGAADGGVWAATASMVYRVPGPGLPSTPVAPPGHDGAVEALALLPDGDGLLLGNNWGLFRLHAGAEPEPVVPGTIASCTALARDGHGRVWAGVPEAVYRWEGGALAGPFGPGPEGQGGRVIGLAATRSRVWVLTAGGLAHVTHDRWEAVPGPPADAESVALRAIAPGPDDAYAWVGTDRLLMGVWSPRRGETRWDPEFLPAHEKDGLNNLARCAAAIGSDGRVAVGTAGGLLTCDREGGCRLETHAGDIRALCSIGNGTLWVLAWPRGVERLTGGGRVVFRPPQPPGLPLAMGVGQDGSPYVVTGRALWRLEAGEPVEVAGTPPAPACCLAQASDGIWWVGTMQGIYRLAGAGWELAGQQPGPLQAEVHALAVIDGTLWAATAAGLWAWHGPEVWYPHVLASPGEGRRVRALAPAGCFGDLWLARDDGVAR